MTRVLQIVADGNPGGGTTNVLALTSDLEAATRTLQKIRYEDGQIGYATRNHFIEYCLRHRYAAELRQERRRLHLPRLDVRQAGR